MTKSDERGQGQRRERIVNMGLKSTVTLSERRISPSPSYGTVFVVIEVYEEVYFW